MELKLEREREREKEANGLFLLALGELTTLSEVSLARSG